MTERSALARWLDVQRELTYLIAHDLRNPLAAMFANLNFLEIAIDPGAREALDAIADTRTSAEQLLRLVDMQVAIARLESDPESATRVAGPIVFADAVRAGLDRARRALDAAGVVVALAGGDTDAKVRAEASLVEQLVDALAHNSSQHVRRGGHANFAVRADASSVTVELVDDGPAFGDPARDFEREGQLALKQGDGRYSRGLGLYLVGLATRALGGTVRTGASTARAHVMLVFPRAA